MRAAVKLLETAPGGSLSHNVRACIQEAGFAIAQGDSRLASAHQVWPDPANFQKQDRLDEPTIRRLIERAQSRVYAGVLKGMVACSSMGCRFLFYSTQPVQSVPVNKRQRLP